MKKLLLVIIILIITWCINGQKLIVDNVDNSGVQANTENSDKERTKASKESGRVDGSDYLFEYSSKIKTGGISIGTDFSEYGYSVFNISMGFGDYNTFASTFGIGAKTRYVINDAIMLCGRIYPYIGIYGSESNEKDSELKYKFAYGFAMNLSGVFKIFNTDKGSYYITGGYYMNALEFETKDFVKNGSWLFGISRAI